MNFNRSGKADYKLKASQIHEMIGLYGVPVTYLFTQKMNKDKVLNDFTHLQLDPSQQMEVYMLPENSEMFDGDLSWGMYGIDNLYTTGLFISRTELLRLYPDFDESKGYSDIINNLIVFPSGAVQEITDFQPFTEGINNLFVYDDEKSVYRIVTRAYSNSKQNEIDTSGTVIEPAFQDIDDYFADLEVVKDNIEQEGDTISSTDSVFGNLG
jgi:hypothetical protein